MRCLRGLCEAGTDIAILRLHRLRAVIDRPASGRKTMPHLVHLRRAVGWCLVAVLATAMLLNVIGFVSPFWGLWRHPDDPAQSRALLHAARPWVTGLSALFLLPAWHLSRTLVSATARGVVLVMGALVVIADVAALVTERAHSDPWTATVFARVVSSLAAIYPFCAFVVFTWLVWRALRIATPRQVEPGAT